MVTEETSLSKFGPPDIVVHEGSSIQAAINNAQNGAVIFIEPGTYKEAIVISKPGIKLVGRSESEVIIEDPGGENNGIRVTDEGDDFTLSNVTIRGFERNGVILIRVTNYLISHVTTIHNGEYGIFPIRSQNGVIEHCVAIGHSDTGIYIGQSDGAEVRFNKVYENVNGIEVENCSDIIVTKNQCYNNTAGILAVLLPGLTVKELKNIQIVHNHVYDNNLPNFADEEGGFEALVPSGSGILFVGGDNSTIEDNNVKGNNFVGIAVVSTLVLGQLGNIPPEAFADIEPLANQVKVTSNVVMKNGEAPPTGLPLPGEDLLWDGLGVDNCWLKNNYNTGFPQTLPTCN
ncbi:right-handed parallel beta-helix repeat-containing protein [Chitinophagaceae bacterium LB-8]|uniref:Right-handed parallel beta-helix repeat-containing protein n=1 Tax=Paraflavisolibacter caeni TaxID=2982496 RepID=A0A9X2XPA7_9BACT|nr:parallel beta-helix domain-containing protein [Paraflavisolibacter caeni]MCU7550828.1 right-handed parallel beta-helix repeat-containing protein [Paraflavisolibacter caeni]